MDDEKTTNFVSDEENNDINNIDAANKCAEQAKKINDGYGNRDVIAWLDCANPNPDGNGFLVYPCLVKDNKQEKYEPIDPADFPDGGAIGIRITGQNNNDSHPTDRVFAAEFGCIVSIKMKAIKPNNSYREHEITNQCMLRYNPNYKETNEDCTITAIPFTNFYLVLNVDCSIEEIQQAVWQGITIEQDMQCVQQDLYQKIQQSVQQDLYQKIQQNKFINEQIASGWGNGNLKFQVFLKSAKDNKLYGPFALNIEKVENKGVVTETFQSMEKPFKSTIPNKYRYTIFGYTAKDYENRFLVIKDNDGHEAITLVAKKDIPFEEGMSSAYDMINNEQLKEILSNSVSQYNSFKNLFEKAKMTGRGAKKDIKKIIVLCLPDVKDENFTESRKKRIEDWLKKTDSEGWLKKLDSEGWLKNLDNEKSIEPQEEGLHKICKEYPNANIDDLEQRKKKLTAENTALEKENGELEEENRNLQKENRNLQKENGNLQKENGNLQKKNGELKEENRNLERDSDSIITTFHEKSEQISRILDRTMVDKILRGIEAQPVIKEKYEEEKSFFLPEQKDMIEVKDAKGVIDHIYKFLEEKAHRKVTKNDVANYLICITQGFITTFAGEPGTGKTSLCSILAKALGLADSDYRRSRFIEVSVERGWASHRDFIGYYNPLSERMECSNEEVFEAFNRMDWECSFPDRKNETRIPPFFILLDEANLSPIEHYWAAFFKSCDLGSAADRSISLGGNKSFHLPAYLRFLATVNFDHTTEELSSRFLDRSWVIMLEPKEIEDNEIDEEIENAPKIISFEILKNAFGITKNDRLNETIQEAWKEIQLIFKDASLSISPRNQKMVRNYCIAGQNCMEGDKLVPLDYALSQKILTLINGNTKKYEKLIDELLRWITARQNKGAAKTMKISEGHLRRMQRNAEENMGFYQFFSR